MYSWLFQDCRAAEKSSDTRHKFATGRIALYFLIRRTERIGSIHFR